MEVGVKIIELAQEDMNKKADATRGVKALGALRERARTLAKVTKDEPKPADNIAEYIACLKERQKLHKKEIDNSKELFEAIDRTMQTAYNRICKHHLKSQVKEWMMTQVDILKATNKMGSLPAWPFSQLQYQENLVTSADILFHFLL